jgi:short-subunit dehydrogenase
MEDLANQSNITLLKLDVTSPDQISKAVEEVRKVTGGELHYLINNAGQLYSMPAIDSDLAAVKSLFEVNFWAPVALIQAFTPFLRAAQGTIINIGSIAGVTPFPSMSMYSASKAALHAFSTVLGFELARHGVRVLTVITGAVQSKIRDNAPNFSLPNGSIYKDEGESLGLITSGHALEGSMTQTDVYAENVLDDIFNGKTGNIWHGKYSGLTRWVLMRLPQSSQIRRSPS